MKKEECSLPLVSVVMPAYNAVRWIAETIVSVQRQTVQDWELLVIDDGSTDKTCSVVEQLATGDGRIKLVRCPSNQGVAKARNIGLDMSRGQYVALLDSDDIWYPEKLERQIALAEKTGAGVIYCSYGIVDDQGVKICDDFIVPETTDFEASLVKSVISCSTVLFSRRIVDAYRFGSAFYHEDLALWLRILRDGHEARGVREPMADYRVLPGSRSFNKFHSIACRWDIYRSYLGLSHVRSASLLTRYAILGLRKYRKIGNRTLR